MQEANDNNATSGLPDWAVRIGMRHYVRMIEDTCAQSGLDPERFLRMFCDKLEARGFSELANIEEALSLLQTRPADSRVRLVSPDENANVE